MVQGPKYAFCEFGDLTDSGTTLGTWSAFYSIIKDNKTDASKSAIDLKTE